jgi:hypothetical protein
MHPKTYIKFRNLALLLTAEFNGESEFDNLISPWIFYVVVESVPSESHDVVKNVLVSNCHAMGSEHVKLLEVYVGTKYGRVMFRLFYPVSKQSVQVRNPAQSLSTMVVYLRLRAISIFPKLKLKDYPVSAVCDCIINIFAANPHNWKSCPPFATWGRAMQQWG